MQSCKPSVQLEDSSASVDPSLRGRVLNDPLWHKLEQFEVDEPNCQLSFSERASKENAWRQTYTRESD